MSQLFLSILARIDEAVHVSIFGRQTCSKHDRVSDQGHWNGYKEINFWSDWEVDHVHNHLNENVICIELSFEHSILFGFRG